MRHTLCVVVCIPILPTRQVLKVLFRRTSRICFYYLNITPMDEQNKFWKEYRSGYKNIFPRATHAFVIRIYADKICLVIRETAHKSVVAATKLSNYYEIVSAERYMMISVSPFVIQLSESVLLSRAKILLFLL